MSTRTRTQQVAETNEVDEQASALQVQRERPRISKNTLGCIPLRQHMKLVQQPEQTITSNDQHQPIIEREFEHGRDDKGHQQTSSSYPPFGTP